MKKRIQHPRWHTVSLLAVVALFCMSTVSPVDAQPREIKGRVQVVDGDTLSLGRIKVRLNGIDAPERGQPRFAAATRALQEVTAGQVVTCRLNGEKSYDRHIGSCFVGSVDVAAVVIASGNALDCARYSGGRYRSLETQEARRYITQAPYC